MISPVRFLFLSVCSAMLLVSCGKDSDEPGLPGLWKQSHVISWNESGGEKVEGSELRMSFESQGFYIRFIDRSSGERWQQGLEDQKIPFTYRQTADRLVFNYDDHSMSWDITSISRGGLVLLLTAPAPKEGYGYDTVYYEYHYDRVDR